MREGDRYDRGDGYFNLGGKGPRSFAIMCGFGTYDRSVFIIEEVLFGGRSYATIPGFADNLHKPFKKLLETLPRPSLLGGRLRLNGELLNK